MRQPGQPLSKYRICDYLDSNLADLYTNECIFDRFDLQWSHSGSYLSTGGYNDSFTVLSDLQY